VCLVSRQPEHHHRRDRHGSTDTHRLAALRRVSRTYARTRHAPRTCRGRHACHIDASVREPPSARAWHAPLPNWGPHGLQSWQLLPGAISHSGHFDGKHSLSVSAQASGWRRGHAPRHGNRAIRVGCGCRRRRIGCCCPVRGACRRGRHHARYSDALGNHARVDHHCHHASAKLPRSRRWPSTCERRAPNCKWFGAKSVTEDGVGSRPDTGAALDDLVGGAVGKNIRSKLELDGDWWLGTVLCQVNSAVDTACDGGCGPAMADLAPRVRSGTRREALTVGLPADSQRAEASPRRSDGGDSRLRTPTSSAQPGLSRVADLGGAADRECLRGACGSDTGRARSAIGPAATTINTPLSTALLTWHADRVRSHQSPSSSVHDLMVLPTTRRHQSSSRASVGRMPTPSSVNTLAPEPLQFVPNDQPLKPSADCGVVATRVATAKLVIDSGMVGPAHRCNGRGAGAPGPLAQRTGRSTRYDAERTPTSPRIARCRRGAWPPDRQSRRPAPNAHGHCWPSKSPSVNRARKKLPD